MTDNKHNDEDTDLNEHQNEHDEEFVMPEDDGVQSGVPLDDLTAEGFNSRLHQDQASIKQSSSALLTTLVDNNKLTSLLSGMSVKTKLVGSLSVLTLIILVIGGVSYKALSDVATSSEIITTEYVELAKVSEEMKTMVYNIRGAEKEFLILEEQDVLNRSTRYLTQLRTLLEKATLLGDKISDRSGLGIGAQYLIMGETIDNYEQQFASQVKDITQARSAINKDFKDVQKTKDNLLRQSDALRNLAQGLVDDFFIDSKRTVGANVTSVGLTADNAIRQINEANDSAKQLLKDKQFTAVQLVKNGLSKAQEKVDDAALDAKQLIAKQSAAAAAAAAAAETARGKLALATNDAIALLTRDTLVAQKLLVSSGSEATDLVAQKAAFVAITAKELTQSAGQLTLDTLTMGTSLTQLNTNIANIQLMVARYLQLNQQQYVDAAQVNISEAKDLIVSVRQLSSDEKLNLNLKKVASQLQQFQQLLLLTVNKNVWVVDKKKRIDLKIANQKNELKISGEKLLSVVGKLSGGPWNNVKQEEKKLLQISDSSQNFLIIIITIGIVLGVLVILLVPAPILNTINNLLLSSRAIAKGDLNQVVVVESNDELGVLADNFETMRGSLSNLVNRIQHASIQINTVINEIQAASSQQSASAIEQSSSLTEFLATMTEMAQSAEEVSKNARSISEDAGIMATDAAQSSDDSAKSLEAMSAIEQSTTQTAERIKNLNDQMDGINDAVETIVGVADQTTLLSLNAAIEANKAGEMGKGFAVVATEIRRLSDRSNEAASSIGGLVRDIQRSAESSVVSMDKSTEEIRLGYSLVSSATDTMMTLNQGMQGIGDHMVNISASSDQQQQATQESQSTVAELLASANASSQAANTTSSAAQELASMAAQLASSVAAFKTN